MISNKEVIQKMIDPAPGSADTSAEVIKMCKNNLSMTKKVAKLLIKGINNYASEKVAKHLKLMKKYLLIDDDLQLTRLELVLGVPQIVTKKQFR